MYDNDLSALKPWAITYTCRFLYSMKNTDTRYIVLEVLSSLSAWLWSDCSLFVSILSAFACLLEDETHGSPTILDGPTLRRCNNFTIFSVHMSKAYLLVLVLLCNLLSRLFFAFIVLNTYLCLFLLGTLY